MADMMWSAIQFGRHQGRTLPHLLFVDPDYFFWGHERHTFLWTGRAERLYQRATSIRIPPRYGSDVVVEYIVGGSGRFEGLRVSPADMALDGGASTSFVRPVIDMSVARTLREYDKSGTKIMVRDVKEILFDDPSYRMTEQRAADFFADDSNFVLPGAT